MTTNRSARVPFVHHNFSPLMTNDVPSSDGVAVVGFRHRDDGHELQASAVGEIADRHRLDERSRFRLVHWEIAGRR